MNNILLEIKMKNNTRNTLLITVATAALMAGSGLISAQDMKGNREAPAAADQKAPVGKTDQHPASVPQKSSPPTAQAPLKEKTAPTAQAPVKEKTAPTAQAPAKEKTAPTAQAPLKEKTAPTAQAPAKEKLAPSVGKDETKSGAPAALSAEQHAKIWSTLRGEKAERLSNVHFSTTVGGVIPATVHLYRLPVSIVEYVPQYRDYEYILVGDEILIVDPRTLRIVAVIAA
jgi:Protein of unknown function (DUF1236)